MTCVKCHIAGVLSSILIHGGALFWFINSEPAAVQQSGDEPLALTLAMFQVEADRPLVPQVTVAEPAPAIEPEPVLEPRPEPVSEPKPVVERVQEPVSEPEPIFKPEPVPVPEPIAEPAPELQPSPGKMQEAESQNLPLIDRPSIAPTKPAAPAVTGLQPNDINQQVARAENEYRYIIVKKIEQNKFYPGRVKRMRKEGDVTVEFILNRDGSLQDLKVVETTGPVALKKAALKAIRVSAVFPPFPEISPRESWTFKTSLQYRLQ